MVNQKVHAALEVVYCPFYALEKPQSKRKSGQAAIVKEQVLNSLKDLTPAQVSATTLAYEPVWAIGTGKTASPEEAQNMHAFIRSVLADNFPSFVANDIRIQYGGSVKPHNAGELLAQDIDGALVGGASLNVNSFVGILTASLERTMILFVQLLHIFLSFFLILIILLQLEKTPVLFLGQSGNSAYAAWVAMQTRWDVQPPWSLSFS